MTLFLYLLSIFTVLNNSPQEGAIAALFCYSSGTTSVHLENPTKNNAIFHLSRRRRLESDAPR